jgi:hypothetical protein
MSAHLVLGTQRIIDIIRAANFVPTVPAGQVSSLSMVVACLRQREWSLSIGESWRKVSMVSVLVYQRRHDLYKSASPGSAAG